MAILANILAVILSYFITSDVVFLALRRFLRHHRTISDKHLFWLSRGTGPVVISLLLYVSFRIFPHRDPRVHLFLVAVFFLLVFYLSRAAWTHLRGVYGGLLRDVRKLALSRSSVVLLPIIVLFSLATLILGLAYPIVEHDSLTMVIEARIMVREMSIENYLAVSEADAQSGYYTGNFRTPCLQMFYVWFALLRGLPSMDLLARTASPIYGLHCLLLLGYVVHRRWSPRHALWAVFLLMTTPIFFYMSYNNSVDPFRMHFAFLTLLWFKEWIDQSSDRGRRLTWVAGAFSGFALYSHLLGAPAILAGVSTYLFLKRQVAWKKAAAVLLLVVTAVAVGAQYHYFANPALLSQLRRSAGWYTIRKWTNDVKRRVGAARAAQPPVAATNKPPSAPAPAGKPTAKVGIPPTPMERAKLDRDARRYAVPMARGQGRTPWSQLIFGRLQVFTGVEHFAFLFYLFCVSIALWLRDSSRTTLDKLMVAAIATYGIVVLSGLRKYSWSNPRYIGSIILIAAFFACLVPPLLEDHLSRRAPRFKRTFMGALICCLIFPVMLVTAIRGAKIEITNRGNFYSDFRSMRWLDYTIQDPRGATRRLGEEYLGIRKTIEYLWADDETKLKHAHDYFAAVQFINANTPPSAYVLTFRDARFYYYGKRRGIVWYHPEIAKYRKANNGDGIYRILRTQGITHVLIDSYSETQKCCVGTRLSEMLADRRLVELVYEYGAARVYALREARELEASVPPG